MENGRRGGTVGWWLGWALVGFLTAMAGFVALVHVANVRVEKQREYREECYKWGPRDQDGDPVCDPGYMPAFTKSGPFFRPRDGAPSEY